MPFISIDQYNQNGVDEDTKLNALLYRKKKAFSKGHGCATNWQLDIYGNCNQIFSDFFPMYDIMPILPSETGERFSGVDFSFYGNSKIADGISCSKANNSIVSNLEFIFSSSFFILKLTFNYFYNIFLIL